jgi:hypothetical protein
MSESEMTETKIVSATRSETPACWREKRVEESRKRTTAAAARPTINHQSFCASALSCSFMLSSAVIKDKRITGSAA